MTINEKQLLQDEAKYCSYGDTVHYVNPPKIFDRCQGSFLFDAEDTPYLALPMWYSAVTFCYANPPLDNALKRQIYLLPLLSIQYLHPTQIYLSFIIAQAMHRSFCLP